MARRWRALVGEHFKPMESPKKLTYGSYEVLQNPDGTPCLLGQGSFGVTYKARHILLGRINALKVIREELLNRGSKEDQEETQRFLSEARAVGRLHHPGIAMVHDCALDNGVFYYAMEYCDGGTLHDWCEKNGPRPWSEVRAMALQIAASLDYAHASGFLHRDIKPANIMLNGEGKARQAKLIDFGLAQKIDSDSDTSSATVRKDEENFRGNFATASPEQILEKPLDSRSDLFSLGVTLWWLLIGKNPFGEMKRGPLIADRVGPSSYASALPPELDPEARSLLEGLLEKDAEKRTATAHEVVERLSAAAASPAPATPATRPAVALTPMPAPPDLEECYQIGGVLATASQAKLYHGEHLVTREPVIVVIPEPLLEPDARSGMRVAASRQLDFGAYAFRDWCVSDGDDVFVISQPVGCSLLAILRKFGPARFADTLSLLSHLARCFDASQAWTGFGIHVDPGEILVGTRDGSAELDGFRAWSDLDPHTVRCLPLFTAGADHGTSSEATLSSSAREFPPLAQFAALVYRVLAGSAVRYAAFFTTGGYVMASGLSEDGNALLAEMLCDPETQPSACRFIQLLAGLESLPVAELTPLVNPPSAEDIELGKLAPVPSPAAALKVESRRPPPKAAPPVFADHAASAIDKAAAQERQLAMAKLAAAEEARQEVANAHRKQAAAKRETDEETAREQAPAKISTETPPARKQEVAARKAADKTAPQALEARQPAVKRIPLPPPPALPQPPAPALLQPPAPSAVRNRRKVMAIVGIVCVLVTTIAALVIRGHGKNDSLGSTTAQKVKSKDEPERPAPDNPPSPDTPSAPDNPPPDVKASTSTNPMSAIKVPGDVKTLVEAVQRCKAGGTIEIADGTYAESLVLTKSVTLAAQSTAVLDGRGLRSNLIVARGPIQVTLRNLQIKNTQEAANTAPESSPALVLISDEASVRFDGCGIEGSIGSGVALAGTASAVFANCTLSKNRGYGINVSSASKVEVSLSKIRENGRSGIALMNVDTAVTLGSGTEVEANSNHGVEVANGAALKCSGVTIRGNQKVGVIVDGSNSQARFESSCVISANRKYGIGVLNAGRVVLSDSAVDDNGEGGLYAKTGAQVEILGCHFMANGPLGASLMDKPSKLSIAKTEFKSHSSLATAFEQGNGTVTECSFLNNDTAIYFGDGASGSAVGNTSHLGPLEDIKDALVRGPNGEVIRK
ncbi:MAG: protein kinase [Verrucomicrobiota bacterium]